MSLPEQILFHICLVGDAKKTQETFCNRRFDREQYKTLRASLCRYCISLQTDHSCVYNINQLRPLSDRYTTPLNSQVGSGESEIFLTIVVFSQNKSIYETYVTNFTQFNVLKTSFAEMYNVTYQYQNGYIVP